MPTLEPGVLARLREDVGGDAATMRELVDSYLDEAPKLLAQLEQAVKAQDAPRALLAAHTLKGLSATFGAMELSTLAKDLEAMAREGTLAGAEERVDSCRQEFTRVQAAMAQLAIPNNLSTQRNANTTNNTTPTNTTSTPGATGITGATGTPSTARKP